MSGQGGAGAAMHKQDHGVRSVFSADADPLFDAADRDVAIIADRGRTIQRQKAGIDGLSVKSPDKRAANHQ